MSNRITKHGEALRASGMITPIMVFALVLLFIMGATAHAHGVHIFAWMEGDTIYTDSYYSSEEKVKDGVVKVFNSSGEILLEGKTDANGGFVFKIPGPSPLRIVLETGMGHGAEFVIEVDEIASIARTPLPFEEGKDHEMPSTSRSREDVDQVKAVEETTDSSLKPITKALAEIERDKGPGLREIVAGIGYIVGIMGIILYFRAKKRP